jgi:hypothetical protein
MCTLRVYVSAQNVDLYSCIDGPPNAGPSTTVKKGVIY